MYFQLVSVMFRGVDLKNSKDTAVGLRKRFN